MRKFAAEIIAAWRTERSKTSGRYYTDGTSVWAYNTLIATRAIDGRKYIVTGARGDGAAHLIGCLRSTFPRAIAVAKIDTYYAKPGTANVTFPPRRPEAKIQIERRTSRKAAA